MSESNLTNAWVVGDLHGCYKTFKKLLKQIPVNDPIYLVGDLMDRGPQSFETIQFVMDHADRIKCVKGNHELLMLEFYKNGAHARMSDVWLNNGGYKVYLNYEKRSKQKLIDHLDFLEKLPYYWQLEDLENEQGQHLLVTHSIALNMNLDVCAANQSLIWGRHFPEEDPSKGKWFNVFGHTPQIMHKITDYYANIDTACCYGNALTALNFPSMDIISIPTDPFDKPNAEGQGAGYAG
jgi:serine/threonine protein phosphatase 1